MHVCARFILWPSFCGADSQVRPGAVEVLGHVAQMLLGMVDVDDFDGAWKRLGGDVPKSMERRRR